MRSKGDTFPEIYDKITLMKLLLTSGGFTNKTIIAALASLVKKPLNDLSLAVIPTSSNIEAGDKKWLIDDLWRCKNDVGFKEIDIVDISALKKEQWLPRLEHADVILVEGGNTYYLIYWLKKSGFAKILDKLLKTRVYVGVSAGSLVAARKIRLSSSVNIFGRKVESTKEVKGLGLVDFYLRPHFGSPAKDFSRYTEKYLRMQSLVIEEPIYALDDQSAILVSGKTVKVISEGKWLRFN